MMNIGNRIKFLSIILGTLFVFTSSVFTQSFDLDNSALKRSTAGQFSSDSDKINAGDIFDLQRAFLSAGYLGNLYSGDYFNGKTSLAQNAVQASFGVPFANGMYLGIIGAYNFSDYANNNNNISIEDKYTMNSQLALRLALRINESLAIHYFLGITPNKTFSSLYKNNLDKQDDNNYQRTIINDGNWKHEIAAAFKFNENMKLIVPVVLEFNASSTRIKGKQNGYEVDYTIYGNPNSQTLTDPNDYIALEINPELDIAMTDKGPLTGVNVGIDIGFNVDNNIGMVGKFGGDQELKVDFKKVKFNISPWVSAPLEWSLAEDKVKLAMEPKFKLDIDANLDGRYTGNGITENNGTENKTKFDTAVISPYIELPIGTMWRPVEWYELRFGTVMMFGANFTVNSTKPETGKETSTFDYNAFSGIAGYLGMGFIIGEDFNIDLYGSIGTPTSAEIYNLANFGGQLTYRF